MHYNFPTSLIDQQKKSTLYDERTTSDAVQNYSKLKRKLGYSNAINNGSGDTRPPLATANDNSDYDELYFEPATEVSTLMNQLERLEVPIIEQESLK